MKGERVEWARGARMEKGGGVRGRDKWGLMLPLLRRSVRSEPGQVTRLKTSHLTRSKTPQMADVLGSFLCYTESDN